MEMELLEKILGESADSFTDEYVAVGFKREYELIEKIKGSLSKEEFEFLYQIIDENGDALYKLICYFNQLNIKK